MVLKGQKHGCFKAANHFEELDRDVGSYAASHPKWISRAKLSWQKTQTGRSARRVGSGGAGKSSLSDPSAALVDPGGTRIPGRSRLSLSEMSCGIYIVF
eukprot:2733529-Amphidinium_carterae.2